MTAKSSEMRETVTSSQAVYSGRILNFRVDKITTANGIASTREIVEHRGAVAIVAMPASDSVLLVRQYRLAARQVLLEIPAGTLEAGEDPLHCAIRELSEETGYKAADIRKVFQSYMAPGYSTELIHTFVATGLSPSPGHADEDEVLEIVTMKLDDAVALIGSGGIQDAKTISGLLFVQRTMKDGR